MFTSTDYDELRQIMDESPKKKELLTRLLDSHRMDISTISHEIRNPLTLVYSTLQLIESQHPEVLSFKHWNGMHQDIEYMKVLLEELSSYNNGERLDLATTDPGTVLKTLVLSFAASLIDTDIEFISRIDPDLPFLKMDAIKIKQALLNILGNAKDSFLSATSEKPSITLEAKHSSSALCITISDTGCGISPDNLTDLFEPFVTHKSSGTGLGLAVTKRIIQAHGGSIEVSSSLGQGTVFTISLPIQQDC